MKIFELLIKKQSYSVYVNKKERRFLEFSLNNYFSAVIPMTELFVKIPIHAMHILKIYTFQTIKK